MGYFISASSLSEKEEGFRGSLPMPLALARVPLANSIQETIVENQGTPDKQQVLASSIECAGL